MARFEPVLQCPEQLVQIGPMPIFELSEFLILNAAISRNTKCERDGAECLLLNPLSERLLSVERRADAYLSSSMSAVADTEAKEIELSLLTGRQSCFAWMEAT